MTSLTPNAHRLLRLLISEGPAYRADLARSLGVSRATVTNLAARLVADGLIEEPDPDPAALKNPIGTTARLGVLASVMFLVDAVTVSLATLDGRVLEECTLHGPPDLSAEERLSSACEAVHTLLQRGGLTPGAIAALHLAVDTQMDACTGDVYAPRASSRWYGVNPKRYFEERFAVPVYAQNTARLEGLAEYLWGAGRAHTDMLYVEVSYGITSGHVVDGLIRSGARGGSGELGHTVYDWNGPLCTCGNSGCLMQYVSVPAMLRDLATGSGVTADWPGFITLVRTEDAAALRVMQRAADVLGRALVNTCHIVDPEVLVLSGEVPRALPGFADEVAAVVRAHALPLVGRNLRVTAAELGDSPSATALAGIASLRAIDEVVAAAIAI